MHNMSLLKQVVTSKPGLTNHVPTNVQYIKRGSIQYYNYNTYIIYLTFIRYQHFSYTVYNIIILFFIRYTVGIGNI